MALPVRIEAKAWDDPRFKLLARRLGLSDPDFALIKTARVWAYQTEVETETIAAELIDAITGIDGFAVALVHSMLAEEASPGVVRMRGTSDPGRIDWREKRRAAARRGGSVRAATATRDHTGRMVAPAVPGPASPILPGANQLEFADASQRASSQPTSDSPGASSPLSLSLSLSLSQKTLSDEVSIDRETSRNHDLPLSSPSGREAGKGKKAENPLAFTVKQLGEAFARGAGARFLADSWDRNLSSSLTRVIRALAEEGKGLGDVEAAGHSVAKWAREGVTWSWLAKPGNLAGAIGKARAAPAGRAGRKLDEDWGRASDAAEGAKR